MTCQIHKSGRVSDSGPGTLNSKTYVTKHHPGFGLVLAIEILPSGQIEAREDHEGDCKELRHGGQGLNQDR